jgi:hypothetical protein
LRNTGSFATRFVAILVTLGVATASVITSVWLLALVASFITWAMWMDEVSRLKDLLRIATYIQHFLEGDLPGLRWETRMEKWDDALRERASRAPLDPPFRSRLLTDVQYPILFVANTAIALYFAPADVLLWLFVLGSSVALLAWVLVRTWDVVKKGRKAALARWKKTAEDDAGPRPRPESARDAAPATSGATSEDQAPA